MPVLYITIIKWLLDGSFKITEQRSVKKSFFQSISLLESGSPDHHIGGILGPLITDADICHGPKKAFFFPNSVENQVWLMLHW